MNDQPGDAAQLRRRAEAIALEKAVQLPENLHAQSPEAIRQTLHELRVHQIELEMQNEELRRAQELLEIARARYFDLYDLAPVGYVTLNSYGLIREANLRTATMLGVSRGNLVGQPLSRFILPEDQDQYYLHRKRLRAAGEPQVCELRVKHNVTGNVLWARIEATLGQDGETQAQVCRATLSDITAQKLAQAALHQAQVLNQKILAMTPSLVYVFDLATQQNGFANRSLASVLGYASEPAASIGSVFLPADVHPDDAIVLREKLVWVATALDGAIASREYRVRDADGAWRWIGTREMVFSRAGDGTPKEIMGIAQDITERKLMEAKLRDAKLQLENQLGELQELHDQLREQAVRDPLTQLYNRLYLNETLPREIALALRHDYAIGILMLDIDHFKEINDTHGHLAGDEALQAIARALTTHLRASDIIVRYGGEEFLCLLINTTEENALQRAEQVRAAIADLPLVSAQPTARVTVSIGVALLPPHGSDVLTILKATDDALYVAKTEGRNCVRLAQPG